LWKPWLPGGFGRGWAIARNAREAVKADPAAGALLLQKADGNLEGVTAKIVTEAAREVIISPCT
jgi:hypothetical protein